MGVGGVESHDSSTLPGGLLALSNSKYAHPPPQATSKCKTIPDLDTLDLSAAEEDKRIGETGTHSLL